MFNDSCNYFLSWLIITKEIFKSRLNAIHIEDSKWAINGILLCQAAQWKKNHQIIISSTLQHVELQHF